MAEFFHNPYHFVPVKEDSRPSDLPVESFKRGNTGHVTHARYMTSRDGTYYSGRVICRLTAESPLVIGGKRIQEKDESHRVTPFELEGKPAIPASSLRGLISSVAEAASNSTLRILGKKSYSRRAAIKGESLSAIGMIVEETGPSGDQVLKLLPLALPTMEEGLDGAQVLPREYHIMFPQERIPPLKVYVGDHRSIRSEAIARDLPARTFTKDAPEYFYAKLHQRKWRADHSLPRDPYQYPRRGRFLLAQQTIDGLPPIPESQFKESTKRDQYTRGILRVLGLRSREDHIPATKRHELFIPYPDDVESIPTFPIAPEALNTFYRLADERTEATEGKAEEALLPFHPRGTRRNIDPVKEGERFRLKEGDLVYFLPNQRGDAVADISLSAIWRKPIPGNSYDYFHRVSPELLPFNRERSILTIAEQLFGFVEQRADDDEEPEGALALTSRARFSFGLLHPDPGKDYYLGETLLKVLDSPKPPYPPFYFRKRGPAGFISKERLSSAHHVPQGRKFYLHQKYDPASPPWKSLRPSDNLKQKSRVQPLRSGLSFYFHIDFYNLSPQELGLLCYALRPSDSFRHKLGMGKPIGLGTVCIDPVAIFYIDREKRYRHDTSIFEGGRYHGVWVRDGEQPQVWPEEYSSEQREAGAGLNGFPSFRELRDKARGNMDADIRNAIELLGEPSQVRVRVHTPQMAGVPDDRLEVETFKWFMENKDQYLQPIDRNTAALQQFKRLQKRTTPGKSRDA